MSASPRVHAGGNGIASGLPVFEELAAIAATMTLLNPGYAPSHPPSLQVATALRLLFLCLKS
jgi:hypothetical protein